MRSPNAGPRHLVVLLVAICAVTGIVAPSAFAAPGVPATPPVVFEENFEHETGPTPVRLTSYVGATGQTYTAAPGWLSGCNGAIVEGESPNGDFGLAGCGSESAYDALRQLAYGQGSFEGAANPRAVHTVAALTDNPGPGPNQAQFETVNPIPLSTANRFLTFSIDVGALCTGNDPSLGFYLLNGTEAIALFSSPIDPCTDPRGVPVPVPAIGSRPASTLRFGTYPANGSDLFTGSAVGIRLVNAQGAGAGNDSAFTNIRILDVSPTLDKSFAPATQTAGKPSTLTFTVTNTSELAAKEGWSFTDNLPSGLVVANPASATTTCPSGQVTAAAGATSVAVKGNLAAGEVSCTVTVDVTSPKAGTFDNCPTNVVTVGLNPPQCARVTFTEPDVSIEKSMTPPSLTAGEEGEYHLKVTNKGPGTAEGVVATDPLPNGVSFVSGSAGCTVAAGTVTCVAGTLAEGASSTFDIKVKVASSLRSCPSNTASVTSSTPDPDPSDNTSQVCPALGREVDLQIEKSARPTTVTSGGQVIYTLIVKNNGPSDASEVKVVDPGADGLDLVGANPSQGSCGVAGGHLSCSLGDLVAGGSAQVLVTAKATIGSGVVDNTATVSAAEKETEPANNQSSARVTVLAGPVPPAAANPPTPGAPHFDLVVKKTAAKKKVAAGQTAAYTITVTNKGPETAPNVSLNDTFNHAGALVSAKPSAGSCGKGLPLSCALGDIQAGATVTVAVVVRPREAAAGQRNAASATGDGIDGNPGDNMGTAAIAVTPKLGIVKKADRKSVRPGGVLHYTIRVTNLSKDVAAREVKTCDRMPSGLALVASKPKATLSKGTPCWTAAKLAAGKSVVYRVTAKVLGSAKGSLRNVATAAGPGGKPVRSSAPVTVPGPVAKPKPTPVTG